MVPVAYTYFDDMGEWVKRRFVSREHETEMDAERREAGVSL